MHGRRRVSTAQASTWQKAESGWQVALWAKGKAAVRATLRRRDAVERARLNASERQRADAAKLAALAARPAVESQ